MATAKELLKKQKAGERINLIDIRAKEKYDFFHFPNAKWIDRQQLLESPEKNITKNEKYYIACNAGNSSSVITHVLKGIGYDVEIVNEGMNPLVKEHMNNI